MKQSLHKRIISVCLTLAMLIQMCPVATLAVTSEEEQYFAQDIIPGEESTLIIGEVTERREESVKHFRLADGSFLAVDYGIPVHYEDTDGQWADIDNTLVEDTSVSTMSAGESAGMYLTANGEDMTAFAQDVSDGFVFAMSKGDVGLSMSLAQPSELSLETMSQINASQALVINPGEEAALMSLSEDEEEPSLAEQIELPKLCSQVLYEDVYENVDLQYDLYGTNVKESIILKEPLSSYSFSFRLNLEGLSPVLREDGSIDLMDGETIVYQIPAPYMLDASMAYSDEVSYALENSGDGIWLLTVTADSQWVEDDDRAWPVTIDPTIIDFSGTENLTFQVVCESNNYYNKNDNLCAGNHYDYGQTESYFTINELVAIPSDCTMVRAYAGFRQSDFYSGDTTDVNHRGGEIRVFMREIAEDVDLENSILWVDRPELGPVLDYVDASFGTIGYTLWDVTPVAKQWYGGNPQKGLALTSNADSIEKCRAYYDYRSTVTLVVAYRNTNGIEPYYTYQTVGIGNAGTAYIGDYSGRLTLSKHLASYASTANPVSVEWVCNSGSAAPLDGEPAMDVSVGTGGQLNIMQKIWAVELPNDAAQSGYTTYLVYTDGDGTDHYFQKDGSYYLDEDGLGLKISVSDTDDYVMSDDSGNQMIFNNHFLSEIQDANGNKILIYYSNGGTPTTTYSSGMTLHSVAQKNNGASEITVAEFGYTGNHITSVTNAAGVATQLTYTNDLLTAISYDGEAVASYQYSNESMTCAYDEEADYGIGFAYASDGTVSQYHEVLTVGGQAQGIVVGISRDGSDETVYRSYGATSSDSDDIITHYLFDYAGRSANAFTTDAEGNILGASNAVYSGTGTTDKKNNRTLRTASIGSVAKNLLTNGNCEGSSGWVNTSFSYGTVKRTGAKGLNSTAASASAYQNVNLQAGVSYTFSGYVATSDSGEGGSVYLEVKSGNTRIAKSNVIDYATYKDTEENWTRVCCSFTPETTGQYQLLVKDDAMPGSVSVDDLQLEVGNAPSNINLLTGGDFESSGWYVEGGTIVTAAGADGENSKMLKIEGDSTVNRFAEYGVVLNLPATQTYVMSGWGKANALPTAERTGSWNRAFTLRATLFYSDGKHEYHQADFNPDITDWQYISMAIVPKESEKTVASIVVVAGYEQNCNTAYFDNITLTLEPAQTMEYNDNGDLEKVTASGQSTVEYSYDGADLIGVVTDDHADFTYTYDDNHNLKTATDGIVTQSYNYSAAGNVVSTVLTGEESSEAMSSSAAYSADSNRQTSVTDSRGSTTTYAYLENEANDHSLMMGLPNTVTNAANVSHSYRYATDGKPTQEYISSTASLAYSYAKGNLTQVTRGGWTAEEGSRTAENKLLQYYTMAYDKYGQMTKFFVGTDSGFQLVENTYNTIGQMTSQTYGNGDVVAYTYDNLGRMVETSVNGETQAQYHYSTDGKLSAIEAKGQRYQYIYDDLDRLIYSGQSDSDGTMVLETRHEYDLKNRLTEQTIRMGATAYTETYEYDANDRLKTMTAGNGDTITPTYNKLNRVEKITTPEYTVNYAYTPGTSVTVGETVKNGTTALVSELTYAPAAGSGLESLTYAYTYDALGNILTEQVNSGEVTTYTYDVQGQLTNVVDKDEYWSYSYDTYGNIRTSAYGGIGFGDSESHTYTYGNATWRDLLTAYDGETILYEGQTTVNDDPTSGNPISYYNGTRWTFDWDNGRELVSAESEDYDLTFEYDHNGIRTSKTVNTVDYVLVEHTWTQTVTAPTCTEAGYTLNECSCGNVYQSDPVSALGHDYTEAITEDQEVFTCTRCGHSYSQDHDHAYTQSRVVPPSCAINGYTVYTCVCGDTTTGESVPALGHNYQETSRDTYWVYYACTRCGATAQEPIVAPPVEVSLLSEESELVEGCIEYEPVDVQTVHEYIYASGKLLRETITTSVEGTLTDTTVLDFYYDQNGRPYSFTCDGEEYFYILNLQGDVVAICDESCNELGSYIYNAWGEITIQSGTIAQINPIRYRGYYYDVELEMYYLQSRYYDPSICRFINADGYASTGQGFIGCNMFAYCNNNAVNYIDAVGNSPMRPNICYYKDGGFGGIGGATIAATSFNIFSSGVTSFAFEGTFSSFVGGLIGGAVDTAADYFGFDLKFVKAVGTFFEYCIDGKDLDASFYAAVVSYSSECISFDEFDLDSFSDGIANLATGLTTSAVEVLVLNLFDDTQNEPSDTPRLPDSSAVGGGPRNGYVCFN